MNKILPQQLLIGPSPLAKTVALPPSKSHTMRALLLGSKSRRSVVRHYLNSPDTEAMIQAITYLGSTVERDNDNLLIQGGYADSPCLIECGNSGQVLRFVAAQAALRRTKIGFTGDESIRTNRPMQPLLSALEQLGAQTSAGEKGWVIEGPIKAGSATLSGADSQPVSALLMAAAFLDGTTTLHVHNPGETPWIDMTLSWLKKCDVNIHHDNYEYYSITGRPSIEGFDVTISGDYSAAAFPLAASLITGESLTLTNAPLDDTQGDQKIIPLLEAMGARFLRQEDTLTIIPGPLKGLTIDLNDMIDALPILAVLGCYAAGTTKIVNAAIARKKESDRITAIAQELTKMGAHIDECEDGLVIYPSPLQAATLSSHGDHRIAMALAVAALGASGNSLIQETSCIAKSFPTFLDIYDIVWP